MLTFRYLRNLKFNSKIIHSTVIYYKKLRYDLYLQCKKILGAFNTKEKCLREITKNTYCINYIPNEHRTLNIFYKLVESNEQICMKNNKLYFAHIKSLHILFSNDVCVEFVKTYHLYRKYVPDTRLSQIIDDNINIIKEDPNMLYYIDYQYQTLKIVAAAFSVNNNLVSQIAPRLRNDEMKKYSIELFKKNNDLNLLDGTVMMGKEFNDLVEDRGFNFVKILQPDEIHFSLQFGEGLIVDPNKFDPDCDCCAGGIYFTEEKRKNKWLGMHTHIRDVVIPDDAVVKIEWDKIKATRIILGKWKIKD